MKLRTQIGSWVLLCTTALISPASASENTRWMNTWDDACYESDGSNSCREEWYTTVQGSHLINWQTFRALERVDSRELFMSKASLARFGFL
ncbi:MAG: hypothetical protein COA43_03800 [Robiginitomaculum sp.]|nr:MAG: hypothetical protein COA43_03800 [Robiginitomaculum sp.]